MVRTKEVRSFCGWIMRSFIPCARMAHTLVVAEPGCTHEGDLDAMFRLIAIAKDCSADVWKAQWTSDPDEMIRRRTRGLPAHEVAEFRGKYMLPYSWLNFPGEWHERLRAHCQSIGLKYACSTYLPQDVATVNPYVHYHKVASFEANARDLLTAHQLHRKPVIVSTGMSSDFSPSHWYDNKRFQLLHCTSAYPAPMDEMNINCVEGCHGLSDHSRNLIAGALAVACNAEIVETHYRSYDCPVDNPDYPVAFLPAEFKQYVKYIRDAEKMLGDWTKEIQPSEAPMMRYRVGV